MDLVCIVYMVFACVHCVCWMLSNVIVVWSSELAVQVLTSIDDLLLWIWFLNGFGFLFGNFSIGFSSRFDRKWKSFLFWWSFLFHQTFKHTFFTYEIKWIELHWILNFIIMEIGVLCDTGYHLLFTFRIAVYLKLEWPNQSDDINN